MHQASMNLGHRASIDLPIAGQETIQLCISAQAIDIRMTAMVQGKRKYAIRGIQLVYVRADSEDVESWRTAFDPLNFHRAGGTE
jgi:hypothetical protein